MIWILSSIDLVLQALTIFVLQATFEKFTTSELEVGCFAVVRCGRLAGKHVKGGIIDQAGKKISSQRPTLPPTGDMLTTLSVDLLPCNDIIQCRRSWH
jgi:hypothetical protein